MALERKISIKVVSDEAKKQLDDLLKKLKQFDSSLSTSNSTVQNTSKQLREVAKSWRDYNGALTLNQRLTLESTAVKTKEQRKTLELDRAVRELNKKYQEGSITQKEYRKALKESGKNVVEALSSTKELSSFEEKRNKILSSSEKTQKKYRTTLLDVAGVLANEQRLLQQSTGNLTYAEQATLRYDTAVRKLNKANKDGKLSQEALNAALKQAATDYELAYKGASDLDLAAQRGRGAFRAMRGSLSQVGYQIQDIAVQAQMGTNAFIILGQQGSQLASLFGPAGALLGAVIALGSAIAGPMVMSMLDMVDAGKELESSMSSLGEVFERTAGGSYVFTDAILDLKRASDSMAELKIAYAVYEAQKAVSFASRGISDALDDATGSWYSFFTRAGDVDVDRITKGLDRLKEAGLSYSDIAGELSDPSRRWSYLVSSDLSGIKQGLKDANKEFGVSEESALALFDTLNVLKKDGTKENFENLAVVLNNMRKEVENVGTKDQKDKFIQLANTMAQMAIDGANAAQMIEAATKNINGQKIGFASGFDQAAISAAMLNSKFDQTSSLILDISDEYERLNKLQQETAADDYEAARNAARSNTLSIIAKEISGYETIGERLKLINDKRLSGLNLSEEEKQLILDMAEAQNRLTPVYEKQISFLRSIKDIIVQSTDASVEFANQTEAWKELAEQVSKTFNDGAEDYSKSVGSYNESLQGLVSSTFKKMEDALVEFAITGKGSFKDFANSVLADLLRIQIQQQLTGFASAISAPAPVGGATTVTSAKGNVFDSNGHVSRYATGGITGLANTIQSTPKRFANGSGLLGEAAQPEAIIPLTRTSGGDLGVKADLSSSQPAVNVNITNEAGIQSQVTGQRTNSDGSISIDVVSKMVNQVIASGKADATMRNRYALRRQGA